MEQTNTPGGRWVIEPEPHLLTTPDLTVPIVIMKCRFEDRDGGVLASFDIPLDYPAALGFAIAMLEAGKLANLRARVVAGDEKARAELEEQTKRWDNDRLNHIYGGGPPPAV
ncbi:MAG TPA: hypothetical protein VIN65_10670 [Candidatus Dormibacteraeota bacterium]